MMQRPYYYPYDIETYPNVFTMCIREPNGTFQQFEISEWRNDAGAIRQYLMRLASGGYQVAMVGFNNLGFDYPVIHHLLASYPNVSAPELYAKAMAIIDAQDSQERFRHLVWPSDWAVPQIDLFKIHHFDNKNRRTSLKAIEFAMGKHSIDDLPFPVGTVLTREQVPVLHAYNKEDVIATHDFMIDSQKMLDIRHELSAKRGKNMMNMSDKKIGSDFFMDRLTEVGLKLKNGKEWVQTHRAFVDIGEVLFPWIDFKQPQFKQALEKFRESKIKSDEIKGYFKNFKYDTYGIEFSFGSGGLHASVNNRILLSDNEYVILDWDVEGYYPSTAIVNRLSPEHFDERFSDVYSALKKERRNYPKKTHGTENGMYKLAMNGAYGDSNSKFSPFYDPKYMLATTVNGQLILCKLVEMLHDSPAEIEMIQVNTDGITFRCRRDQMADIESVRTVWQVITGLMLEEARYSKMMIRDVNNYVAQYEDGSVKRKGAFEYKVEWHKNHSNKIVAMAVEHQFLYGGSLRDYIESMTDDLTPFMIMFKVTGKSKAEYHVGDEVIPLQKTNRFYASKAGGTLRKIMPPLKVTAAKLKKWQSEGKTEDEIAALTEEQESKWRESDFAGGATVCVCNNLDDATAEVDVDYYCDLAERLIKRMVG